MRIRKPDCLISNAVYLFCDRILQVVMLKHTSLPVFIQAPSKFNQIKSLKEKDCTTLMYYGQEMWMLSEDPNLQIS